MSKIPIFHRFELNLNVWEFLPSLFGGPFLSVLPARRRRASPPAPQLPSSSPSTATATHSPSFYSFSLSSDHHLNTVPRGLHALSDAIALHHRSQRWTTGNLALHGPSLHAVHHPQPRPHTPTTTTQIDRPPPQALEEMSLSR